MTSVEPHHGQPGQHRGDEHGHEYFVGGGLVPLQHRPQTFGEQCGINPIEPPAAKGTKHDTGE
jgi:hypothetical protein